MQNRELGVLCISYCELIGGGNNATPMDDVMWYALYFNFKRVSIQVSESHSSNIVGGYSGNHFIRYYYYLLLLEWYHE